MTKVFDTAAVQASGLSAGRTLSAALMGREDILTMTQQAHEAALTPDKPGGLSHAERAALSCRMARLNEEDGLAAYFLAMIGDAPEQTARMADITFDGGDSGRLVAILRHTDLVTKDTKGVVAGDIAELISAGISEDDIVRLSELVSFVSYQIRLTVGLRLMGEAL